jgi:outer membrane protein OmpA-like peptidoglycan-associated protein
VTDRLPVQGVPAASVTLRSDGATQPLVGKDTPGGQDLNRRVDLYVVHDPP